MQRYLHTHTLFDYFQIFFKHLNAPNNSHTHTPLLSIGRHSGRQHPKPTSNPTAHSKATSIVFKSRFAALLASIHSPPALLLSSHSLTHTHTQTQAHKSELTSRKLLALSSPTPFRVRLTAESQFRKNSSENF